MRQSHLILSNAAIMWITRILVLIPQLIMVPYLIKTIGEDGYGVYSLVWSLVVSIDQLEISLQSGVIKYSAAFLAQKEINKINKVVSSSFIYSIFLAVLSCASIIFITFFLKKATSDLTHSLFIISMTVLFIIPLTPYVAIIQSKQLFFIDALSDTISKYLSLLTLVWFYYFGPSVESAIIIMSMFLFFTRFIQVPIAYRLIPGLQNRLIFFDKKSFLLINSFGSATILASLCIIANSTGIRWMMSILESTSFVAHLAIILMPTILMSQLIQAMTITIMPATSAYEAIGKQTILHELLIRSMRYSVILLIIANITAIILMKDILNIWVGSDYVFLGIFAIILFVSRSFMLSTATAHNMLKGIGVLWSIVFSYFLGQVIVPFLFILIMLHLSYNPYYAVTIGLSIGCIICGVLHILLAWKRIKINFVEFSKRVYIQPLFSLAIVSFPILFVSHYFNQDRMLLRILFAVFINIIFCALFYFFFTTKEERIQINEIFRTLLLKTIYYIRL